MSSMQVRFKRAFDAITEGTRDYHDVPRLIREDELCLRWLRNEAELWSDYEPSTDYIVNGVDYNPNHPDNLSSAVWELWKTMKLEELNAESCN